MSLPTSFRLAALLLAVTCGFAHPAPGQQHVDNGDGTLSHAGQRLMWIKKVAADRQADPENPHDADNRYDAAEAAAWLAELNEQSFAGHADWRLPNAAELAAAMPDDRHPVRSERFSMFHRRQCRRGCVDLEERACSCVAVGTDALYRTSTDKAGGGGVEALGYLTQEPGLARRSLRPDDKGLVRAVRNLAPDELVRVERQIEERESRVLPNEIHAGLARPKTEAQSRICQQGCSSRFLRDNRGDVLVECLKKCRLADDESDNP